MAKRTDATVARQTPEERAAIEAKRGITRDAEGRIVRSKAWLRDRIAALKEKREDFKARAKNADAEIAAREKELKAAK